MSDSRHQNPTVWLHSLFLTIKLLERDTLRNMLNIHSLKSSKLHCFKNDMAASLEKQYLSSTCKFAKCFSICASQLALWWVSTGFIITNLMGQIKKQSLIDYRTQVPWINSIEIGTFTWIVCCQALYPFHWTGLLVPNQVACELTAQISLAQVPIEKPSSSHNSELLLWLPEGSTWDPHDPTLQIYSRSLQIKLGKNQIVHKLLLSFTGKPPLRNSWKVSSPKCTQI